MEEKRKRGPKPKHPDGFKELHLKFSGAMLEHIQKATEEINYQDYFDQLVKRDMEKQRAK
jgi:hypothetical protein